MRKPSIFSSNYEEQMRRRRINITLIILILISAAFFTIKYFLNKNSMDFNINLFKVKEPAKQQIKTNSLNNKSDSVKNIPQQKIENTQKEEIFTFEYKNSKGIVYKIDYVIKNNQKQFIKLTGDSNYDISQDKKYIVFDDMTSNDIILMDTNGNYKKLTKLYYESKSTGQIYKKDTILSYYPKFIWSLKPHFTNDGRIVYVSQLPYFRKQNEFYLWSVNVDGSNHRKIGFIGNDFNSIVYDGYDSEGNIRIRSANNLYYVKKGTYFITK